MEQEKIRNWGTNYTEEPREEAWDRIEARINESPKTLRTIAFWKKWAIAASVLLVISVGLGVKDILTNHQESVFAYNVNQKPLKLEELEVGAINIYFQQNQIEDLNQAYKKALGKNF